MFDSNALAARSATLQRAAERDVRNTHQHPAAPSGPTSRSVPVAQSDPTSGSVSAAESVPAASDAPAADTWDAATWDVTTWDTNAWDIDTCDAEAYAPASPRSITAQELIDLVFDDAVANQTLANQTIAHQIFAVHEAFEIARQYPRLYVPVGAPAGSPDVDEIDFAVRSVAFDLAQRLAVSENVVRDYDRQAAVLATRLPKLRELFLSGRISQQHVRAAVDCAEFLPDEATTVEYDERIAKIAEGLRCGEFARRCRLLRDRMCADTMQERHDRARDQRRVSVETADDGMAWLNAYLPVMDAAGIEARLQAAARAQRLHPGEHRTLAQLRADALVGLLLGDAADAAHSAAGSDAAPRIPALGSAGITVQPFLLIDADGRFAELLGYGPVDPRSAAMALRDAPSFRRVFADPVDPAKLTLDRRRYRPSPDQLRWLKIRYGLDDSAAPFLCPGAEIDHVIEFQHGGDTDVDNLVPLKPRLHRLKSVTRIRLDPKPDGGIRVRTPTGYDSDPPPF
ncbi:DUF222 domain-containing protein [Rathayibacter sp. KR2-224]|uniref:HNH endonuclease signature motif containing protein n=1 Tax=Rathayibacter sp. KR2-224 TaxID=3400913 RepID=UPI003C09D675